MVIGPNKTWVFKKPPTTLPEPGVHTTIEDRPLQLLPPPGGLVVKLLTAGLDPHQRDRMRGAGQVSYVPGYEVDKPITNFCIGIITRSDDDELGFEEGSLIAGMLPIAQYGVIPRSSLEARLGAAPLLWKVKNEYVLPLKHFVGALGLAGMTAWNGFYGLVKPVKGQTIWVNGASGSVGEVVVQLAKLEGMRVIASVSSQDKLNYAMNELGADAAFNYHQEESISEALKRLAPDGLDVVFENVGGGHFQAAVENMKCFGRIISCGMASQYNKPVDEQYGVKNLPEIFRRRITIQGFIFSDENVYPDNIGSFWEKMPKWISEDKIKARYTEFEGIEEVDRAFTSMFTGKSFGKTIVRIGDA